MTRTKCIQLLESIEIPEDLQTDSQVYPYYKATEFAIKQLKGIDLFIDTLKEAAVNDITQKSKVDMILNKLEKLLNEGDL